MLKYLFISTMILFSNILMCTLDPLDISNINIPPEHSTKTSEELLDIGVQLQAKRDYKNSAKFCSYAIKRDKSNYLAYIQLGCADLLLDKKKLAHFAFQKGLELNPKFMGDLNEFQKIMGLESVCYMQVSN